MKSTLLIIFITMASYSFIPTANENYINHKASQDLANQVVNALNNTSSRDFIALAPTVDDFRMIMHENAELYGGHLTEAQEAFAADYLRNTLPEIEKSFDTLIECGRRRGIDWNNLTLVSWETVDLMEGSLTSAPFIIAIESGGKLFRVEIEKALYISGHWHVSQYVKLI